MAVICLTDAKHFCLSTKTTNNALPGHAELLEGSNFVG
uniref:Uncharacterized protein n=1 Tax=Lepeophtheirus salmonis TaxID=72036 RepID=A0A0K2TSN8_LEPSM